jgi:hypothetical protein
MSTFLPPQPHFAPFVLKRRIINPPPLPEDTILFANSSRRAHPLRPHTQFSKALPQRPQTPRRPSRPLDPQIPPPYPARTLSKNGRTPLQIQRRDELRRLLRRRRAHPQETRWYLSPILGTNPTLSAPRPSLPALTNTRRCQILQRLPGHPDRRRDRRRQPLLRASPNEDQEDRQDGSLRGGRRRHHGCCLSGELTQTSMGILIIDKAESGQEFEHVGEAPGGHTNGTAEEQLIWHWRIPGLSGP